MDGQSKGIFTHALISALIHKGLQVPGDELCEEVRVVAKRLAERHGVPEARLKVVCGGQSRQAGVFL